MTKFFMKTNYIELKYADNIGKILPFYSEQRIEFSKKAIDLLGKAKDSRKTYTRTGSGVGFSFSSGKRTRSDIIL